MRFIDVINDYNELKESRDALFKLMCQSKDDEFIKKITKKIKEVQDFIDNIELIEVEHNKIVG